jgi:Tfp pilus assembly protein PilP
MIGRVAMCFAVAISIAGCGGQHEDLKAWMQEQGKGVKGKLDPLDRKSVV